MYVSSVPYLRSEVVNVSSNCAVHRFRDVKLDRYQRTDEELRAGQLWHLVPAQPVDGVARMLCRLETSDGFDLSSARSGVRLPSLQGTDRIEQRFHGLFGFL